jgi:hypothetical protein
VIAVPVGVELRVGVGFALVGLAVGDGFLAVDDGLVADADELGTDVARAASRPFGWLSAAIATAPTATAKITARTPPTSSNFLRLGPVGAECDIKY